MAQEVTLGGDRLGSGKKQTVELHNYQMSSFNLSQDFKSSMAPGILYPFLKMVGTNHGTFDIDLDSFIRTIPTKGPLFGSFKFQADIFCVPIRLYQGILHNNPVDIGLKMNQVYLPKLLYKGVDARNWNEAARPAGSNAYNFEVADNSLMKYLGVSGIGRHTNGGYIQRKINAIPFLAYYDIFKNYYSNKQEEKAYVITPGTPKLQNIVYRVGQGNDNGNWIVDYNPYDINSDLITINNIQDAWERRLHIFVNMDKYTKAEILAGIEVTYADADNEETKTLEELGVTEGAFYDLPDGSGRSQISFTIQNSFLEDFNTPIEVYIISNITGTQYTSDIQLTPFDLKNIDTMRKRLLATNDLGEEFIIDQTTDLMPYSALVNQTSAYISWNAFQQNGLVVKTYQSDLFNNWLNSETVDLINSLAAVTVTEGSFTVDSLNFAEKVYDVLNRIGVSGGTYEDWQEAVWGQGAVRKAETPIYCGGMSSEIMFEEVISTAETNVKSDNKALGSLAGKGTQVGKNGGNNIHIKCEEPSYIIGICSITPRIAYSQGNDWDMFELDTLDDLHKPGMDGIGFQNLMVEQMAWWDTKINFNSPDSWYYTRNSAGKQTAWINYQTAVDKVYGDFAKQDGYAFMVLNRNYEIDTSDNSVKDITTYIDPAKYNYAFADTDLAAQNFWVQIHSNVVARRKMAAQQIPNL